MAKEMVGAKIIAGRWNVSVRRINQLCNAGEIDGAIKEGGIWKIPSDVFKPTILRNKKEFERIPTTKLLPCPVGVTSYKEVSSECYYVDKTRMIKDIIDDHNKVMLFTRPRRFGKTLTMDMIKTYFEKSNEDNSIYFINREIWNCGDSYRTYQGAYPVIFLSFKDAHQATWQDMYESLTITIRNEYKRHIEVLKNNNIADIDKQFFEELLSDNVSKVEYQSSLGILSHILSAAYNSRVIVIIDEYDTPIQQGYNNGYYNEIIDFMRNLFSAVLKDNDVLEFGILTGILRVAKESLFSGLNNLIVNTILDERYSNYFGFTTQEVKEMAEYYDQSEKMEEINKWYDGYIFGKSEIYNPWSVISYFNNNCVPKAFWSRTSSNDMVLDIIRNGNQEIQKSLINLLQDHPVQAIIDTDVIYPEIKSSADTIYSFLLMTGYLKIESIASDIGDIPICNLLIPNKEIKNVFKKDIIDNLSKNIENSIIRNFQLALKTNDKETLQNTLQQYLLVSTSYLDVTQENFYHGMMLGLLAIMSDDYQISSNRESGEGRFDIQLKPISNKYPGIIMEFKSSDSTNDEVLSKLADDAIQQIIDKKYDIELKTNGVNDVELYGIAFGKKNVKIKNKQIPLKD